MFNLIRKNNALKIVVMIFSMILFTNYTALCSEQNDVLIFLNDGVTFKEVREYLEESGIKPSIFFSPNSVYISDFKGDIDMIEENEMIKSVFFTNIDPLAYDITQDERVAVSFFNYKKRLDAGIANNRARLISDSGALTQPKDFLRHEKRDRAAYPAGINNLVQFQKPVDFYFTSEYLIGDIAVAVVLPESDGSFNAKTESWDNDDPDVVDDITRIDDVLNKFNSVLAWWVNRVAGTLMYANLTFYVKTYIKVPTKYEIINLTSGGILTEEYLWVGDVLANMGYGEDNYPSSEYDYLDKAFAFNNNLRNGIEDPDIKTDWGVTFFIIDSLNDDDGKFANGAFAYTYGGGPFTVLTYDNENYGIERFWEVALHESTHLFYALDEYAIANEPCDTESGYLSFPNFNSEHIDPPTSDCNLGYFCLMRDIGREIFDYNDGTMLCGYTRGQIGWGDDDQDGIFDPVDTIPALTIDPFEPGAQEFSGSTNVVTTPNLNPLPYPKGVGKIDITTNRIISIQYRLDQDFWIDIEPDDKELGGIEETFSFKPYPPRTDYFTLEVKVVNSVGNDARVIVGQDIYLESLARNDRTSLCFIAQASFYDKEESGIVSKFLEALSRYCVWLART